MPSLWRFPRIRWYRISMAASRPSRPTLFRQNRTRQLSLRNPFFKEKLQHIKDQQEANKKLCGRSYNKEYLEYIYVDEIGDRIKPNYITGQFPKLLEKQGFRRIRFHDLRHSCASLLLASGVPMKNIQEWLGHSDFSTTANIYAHLDYSSKLTSASAMESNFRFQAQ